MDVNSDIYQSLYEIVSMYFSGAALEAIMEEEIIDALLAGVTGATREETLLIAKERTGLLVKNMIEGTTGGLAEVVTSALENQIGADALAKEIKNMIGLDAQRVQAVNKYKNDLLKSGLYSQEQIDKMVAKFTDKQLKDRAKVIAQNEMREAIIQGEDVVMRGRGAKYKAWSNSGDSLVSDGCEENGEVGPIPIDEPFPSGDMLPPRHPRCRCSIIYVTSDEQLEREKVRAEERKERTAKAKSDS